MKILLTLTIAIVLPACVTPASAPTFTPAAVAAPGTTNVYIYRIGAYPTMRRPMISVDGKRVFAPTEGSYTVIALPRGTHELKVDWAWDTQWPDLAFPIAVESEDLYIKISGSFTPAKSDQYEAGSYAQKVAQAAAVAEMKKCCRYIAPRQ
jgi:hypothetical protein